MVVFDNFTVGDIVVEKATRKIDKTSQGMAGDKAAASKDALGLLFTM